MRKGLLIVLCFFFRSALFAQPGSPDFSFGSNGLAVNDFGHRESIAASTVQADGKIIFVGSSTTLSNGRYIISCALARYHADGTPDTSFGKNGLTEILVGNGDADWGSVALQSDGKIVVAGALYNPYFEQYSFVIFRCTKEGIVDSTFGEDGFVRPPDAAVSTYLFDIKVQPDGKIVAAGRTELLASGNPGTSMLALRFLPNGKPDKTFGDKGRKVISIGTSAVATALQILPNGKILMAGYAPPPGAFGLNIAAVRLTAAGDVDTLFGKKGKVITSVGEKSFFRDLLLTGTGQFVIGGVTTQGTDGNFALVRYLANGSPDSSFGTNGIVVTDFGMYDDITALALQPDGKIIAIGSTGVVNAAPGQYRSKFALSRYKKNGKIDTGFGSSGKVITDFGNKISQAYTGFVQADGTIVAAGVTDSSVSGDNDDFALAGYQSGQMGMQVMYPFAKAVLRR